MIVLCLAVYLPGLWTIPPVDRDECRFAQASRQMYEAAVLPASQQDRRVEPETGLPAGKHAGGWVVPMVQGKPRLNKPPLVYWVQVASAWVCSEGDPSADAIWMYRVPSALCALATVLLVWRLGVRMIEPRAAWLGAALLAVAPMVVWDAHQARSDQLLLLCTTAAMACLWRVVRTGGTGAAAGLWLFVGLGVMTKGLITPLVVVSAVGAMAWGRRDWGVVRRTRPLLGLVIVAACVAPWVWLLSRQVGLEVYAREVWKEVFLRAATGAKDGGRVLLPPGLHAVLLAVLFWPGCLLVWPAVGAAIDRGWGVRPAAGGLWARIKGRLGLLKRKAEGREAELFLLAWLVPAWIVFELSPAKLPHYTMPLYPALALLTGRALLAAQARLVVPGRVGVWGWFAVAAFFPVVLAAALWFSAVAPEARVGAVVFVIGLIGLPVWGAMLVAVQFLRGQRWASAAVTAVCAGALMLGLSLHAVVPSLRRYENPKLLTGNVTEQLFAVVRMIDPKGERPLASVIHEDSVVFQSRGRVVKIGAADQAAWLAANPSGILIGTESADAPGRDGWKLGPFVVLAPARRDDGTLPPPPPAVPGAGVQP